MIHIHTLYWISCDFSSQCHAKVDISECIKLYLDYKSIGKREKSQKLRVLIENMKVANESEKRKVFFYSVSGVRVCKGFFILWSDNEIHYKAAIFYVSRFRL